MAQSDTFTGQTPANTYTKIVQITEDNEVLDAVGAQISPIFKAGATVTGSVNVDGTIYQNGQPVGAGAFNVNAQNELYVEQNVGIGTDNPEYDLDVDGTTRTDELLLTGNSSQNNKVGVGTSSPTAKLEIVMDHQTYGGDTPPFFLIKDHTGQEHLKVTEEGNVVLGHKASAPISEAGGIYYNSTDDEFYLGYNG
jgi:hypothetical protein